MPRSCWTRSSRSQATSRGPIAHRHQHRPLPADREASSRIMREILEVLARQPSGRHRHQVGAGDARHRHPRATWPSATWPRWRSRSRRSTASSPARWSRAPRRPSAGSTRSARCSDAGMPDAVMVAPMIPALNDHEIERDPRRRRATPARATAGYVAAAPAARSQRPVPRLAAAPLSRPGRHVMSLVRSMRGGKDYDADGASA